MIGIVLNTDRRFRCLGHDLEQMGMHVSEKLDPSQADFVIFGLKGPDRLGKVQLENHDLLSFDESFFQALPQHCLVFSYVHNAYLEMMAARYGFVYMAFEDDERLAKINADLTAEACISELIARRPYALSGSRISILGYGRIGKALAAMLQGFHVDGTIVLRNRAYDLAIQALGYRVCRFQDEAYLDADIIINTVPATVLYEAQLERLDKQTMLIELASFPYGFDSAKAVSLGLEVALLPALPAKYAYASSAAAMAQAFCRQLEKRM